MTKSELKKIIDIIPENVRLTELEKIIGIKLSKILNTFGFKNHEISIDYEKIYNHNINMYDMVSVVRVNIYTKDWDRLYFESSIDDKVEYFRYHKNISGPKTYKLVKEISFKQLLIENGKY